MSNWDRITQCLIFVILLVKFGKATDSNEESINFSESSTNATTDLDINETFQPSIITAADEASWEIPLPNGTVTICKGHEWECQVRLDKHVTPIHYDIYIHPYLQEDNNTFSGKVSISLNITANVNHVRIHTKFLQIKQSDCSIWRNNLSLDIKEVLEHSRNQYLVLVPEVELRPGEYELIIYFRGKLTPDIVGLYKASYFDSATQEIKYVVTTKFQPTHARKAFPCFDEPGFKSTYSLSLVKPSELISLSNMPITKEEPDVPSKGYTTVYFDKSPPMVTYLLALAIGDFKCKSSLTSRNLTVRICATSFQVEKTSYAATVVPKMMDFYEEYFATKYPLPKLDVISIPNYISGATEHWGIISMKESNMFYQEGISTAQDKQRVASVLSHELAHMWFGNYVTLQWWNDLWLNEGFASYMEYKGVNAAHPDWKIEDQFVSQDLMPVLSLDGKLSSHPIVQPVSNPDQINEIFDTISYNKGSSVIRMLESFLGPEYFRNGVRKFLEIYAYKNAVTNDLFEQFQKEFSSNLNLTDLMSTWTNQMGYPVVHVKFNDTTVNLTQERFLENRNATRETNHDATNKYNYKWTIPLRIVRENDQSTLTSIVMPYTESTIQYNLTSPNPKFVKINAGQLGYFRVNYEPVVWNNIKEYYNEFSPAERCGLLDDVFSFAFSSYVPYDLALSFGTTIMDDNHLVPWICLSQHLFQLSTLLENSAPDTLVLYQKYVKNITGKVYQQFNWTDSENYPHQNRLLMARILGLSCLSKSPECLDATMVRFLEWINGNATIPSGLRPVVYKWGTFQAHEGLWEKVWNKYHVESDPQERIRILTSLAFTQNEKLIQKLITFSEDESLIQRQDYFPVIKALSRNRKAKEILWTYYRDNYDALIKRFSINDRSFGKLVVDITGDFSTDVKLLEVSSFIENNPEAGASKRARQIAVEKIRLNIDWVQRSQSVITNWLQKQYFP